MNDDYLFLDESGTASLKNVDPEFPVLALTGLLISAADYQILIDRINSLKQKYFPGKTVVLHRRDMRKYENGFEIFFDDNVKRKFYNDLNTILAESNYELISAVIDKARYIATFGKLVGDPYQIALTSILERTLLRVEALPQVLVHIYIESRGKKEDKIVMERYNTLLHRGSQDAAPERFLAHFDDNIALRKKSDLEIGIEIADLCAYPIARYVLNNDQANPAFDVIRPKMKHNNSGNVIGFGVWLFPPTA